MKVKILATGNVEEHDESYAKRLVDMGYAISLGGFPVAPQTPFGQNHLFEAESVKAEEAETEEPKAEEPQMDEPKAEEVPKAKTAKSRKK